MADVLINHRFVSAVADDGDTTLVRPSNWNDTEVLSQGNEGDLVVKRAASTTGASWESVSSLIGSIIANLVSGPASVVNNTLALFDGTTGKLLKQSIETGFIKATAGVISAVTSIVEADLGLTDITTNDSDTAKHGFLKKLDNDAAHFMNGQGNWTIPDGPVDETNLVFTDITTANADTSKHGLLPKLDNVLAHFLNGQGGFTTPQPLNGYFAVKPSTTAVAGSVTVNTTEVDITSFTLDLTTAEPLLLTVSGGVNFAGSAGANVTQILLRLASISGTVLNSASVDFSSASELKSFSFQFLYTAIATSSVTFYVRAVNVNAFDSIVFNGLLTGLQFRNG